MIKKFLYDVDVAERKYIYAVVEDGLENEYNPEKKLPMEDYHLYKKQDNEMVTYNFGDFYYAVFGDKYLDIDTYNDRVGIMLTSKIEHAYMATKEVIAIILDYVNYFDNDDVKLVPSYTGLKKGKKTDAFSNYFKKAEGNTYCQIKKDDKNYFLAQNENYFLSNNYLDAVKVHKNNVRRVLTVFELLDSKTNRHDLSFSQKLFFQKENGFYLDGISISYDNGIFFDEEPLSYEYSLCSDLEKFDKVRAVLQMNGALGEDFFAEINSYYLKKVSNGYQFTKELQEASLISNAELDKIRAALKIFIPKITIRKFNKESYKLFKNENIYSLDGETSPFLISYKSYTTIKEMLTGNFKPLGRRTGVVLHNEGKFVMVAVNNQKLELNWCDSAFKATLFTDDEATGIIDGLQIVASKKEIKSFLSSIEKYNIKEYGENDIAAEYQAVINNIILKKHRICSIENMKVETEKGALEGLRLSLVKTYYDAKAILKNLLEKKIKSIMIVGPIANAEVAALGSLDQEIDLCIVDNSRWGYYNKAFLNKVKLVEYYKVNFENLPCSIINHYDAILFSKNYNVEIDNYYNDLFESKKDIIMINLKTCNIHKIVDYWYNYFSQKEKIARKYINHDNLDFVAKKNEELKILMYQKICRCLKNECQIKDVIIKKENAYYSIIEKKGQALFDYLK